MTKLSTQRLARWKEFAASPAAIEEVCADVADGHSLADFCRKRDFAYTTALMWIQADPTRAELYARAREDRSDKLADEIVAISDEAEVTESANGVMALDATAVQRNRLRVDARKWVAAKLKPRVYGDKLELGGSVKISTVSDQVLLDKLAELGISAVIGPKPDESAGA